jgi:tRNA-2-methylthio-N6-dimethylallyladenosine synthase
VPRIYIETFGCQMNEADSRHIAERAIAAGYSVATAPEEANVVVLNTCTVRDNAERRAYGRMNHLNALKRVDPNLRLVVTGCLAEQDRDRMKRLAPHVDAIFGTRELSELGDQLAAWQPSFEDVDFSDDRVLLAPLGGTADGVTGAYTHLRAQVTVQRGCSYYCTFCIVPHVRGRFDHRPAADIIEETRGRVAQGAREIVLVGQTVNAWKDPATGEDFGDLCGRLVDLAAIPQLNPRIHLPLQSGSDAMLRRMNRKYTLERFDEIVAGIRRRVPECAITTDLIVGFPGESEDDFAATLAYVQRGVFANAFTFIYSIRRGTPAAHWPQVPREIALERFGRLLQAQNDVTCAYHERYSGATVRALIVGDSKKNADRVSAKTLDNVTIVAPKPADYPYDATPWLDVAVESAHVWGCAGTIVGRAARWSDPALPAMRPLLDLVATA